MRCGIGALFVGIVFLILFIFEGGWWSNYHELILTLVGLSMLMCMGAACLFLWAALSTKIQFHKAVRLWIKEYPSVAESNRVRQVEYHANMEKWKASDEEARAYQDIRRRNTSAASGPPGREGR